MHLDWKPAGVQESSGPILAEYNQPATSFPLSGSVLRQTAMIKVQNQPGLHLVLADCIRFGPNRSGPEAKGCARIFWPTSGQCFRANLDRIKIGSSMFTWESLLHMAS